MSHIEKAYKAWRATVKEFTPTYIIGGGTPAVVVRSAPSAFRAYDRRPLTPAERARHAVKSYWQTLTPEQRSERQRKAAKKMWKRRKAEAR